MSARFFGRFLIERGRIDAEQLQIGLALQGHSNVKLGNLAIDLGYMKAEDVQWIHQLQRKRDMRFGELAVETGLLTERQLGELLSSQAHDWILLGEALVKKGFLTREMLAAELLEFGREEQQTPENLEKLYRGRRNARILTIFADVVRKIFLRVGDERVKIVRWHGDPATVRLQDFSICQPFLGKFEGLVCLNMSRDLLTKIAAKLLQAGGPIPEEDAKDGATEFLNIISGHVCSKLANLGLTTELAVPEIYDNATAAIRLADFVKDGQFTATEMLHPETSIELCVIDRSRL